MQAMIEILQSVGVFLAGVLARVGLFLGMLALLIVPALAIALAVRWIGGQRRRALGIRRVAGLLFRPDLFYAPGHTWLRARGERRGSRMRLPRIEWGRSRASPGDGQRRSRSIGGAGLRPATGGGEAEASMSRGGARAQPECPPAVNAGTLELGLDDLAQRLLPSVTAVELPPPGAAVARGETIATLHGGGRSIRIPSPVAARIAGVNAAVLRDPGLVKRDGYGRGWLVAVAPADPSFADLPRGDEAEAWLRRESARWRRFVEERLGFASADGGELIAPAPWLVGEKAWSELTEAFLHVSALREAGGR